ncbi:Gmad2 immunoglobulin-like domain-containing protein [Nocardioides marmoraquaticus]
MNERDLHDLLHDAVADVEPTRDLELGPRPRRGVHWAPVTVAAALTTVLALTGSVWLVQRGGSQAPPAAAARTTTVVAYAVVDTPAGPRLTADPREVDTGEDPLQAAVEQTLLVAPEARSLRPVWFDETPGWVAQVSVSGSSGVVTVDLGLGSAVDLSEAPKDVPLLGQAVAWTVATALDDPDVQVRMTSGGRADASFVPGADTPLLADGAALAPVTVETVADGAAVPSPVTVTGLAATFEGTVTWRLLDGDEVVREGFTTAEQCCTPSPYSFELDAPPGDYVLEVGETDPSDGEGTAPYVARSRLTIAE